MAQGSRLHSVWQSAVVSLNQLRFGYIDRSGDENAAWDPDFVMERLAYLLSAR